MLANWMRMAAGAEIYYNYNVNHVAVWKLDELSGTNVADSVGAFTGTAGAGATIIDGWRNKARRFSGATNAEITFDAKPIPLGAKTIRFKLRRNNNSAVEVILTHITSEAHHGDHVAIDASGYVAWNSYKGTSGTPRWSLLSTVVVDDNQWYDIMLTWGGTTDTNTVKMYIKALDGANAGKWHNGSAWVGNMATHGTTTALATEVTAATNNMLIGEFLGGGNNYAGDLDEIEISNIARDNMLNYK